MRWKSIILCSLLAFGLAACGNGAAPGGKIPFKAPLLNDPNDLKDTVDIKGNVNFGENKTGNFSDKKPLIGYFLDANRGARLTLELQASQDSNDDPVLLLYGPSDASGLFGEKLAMDDDSRDGRNSLIDGLVLPADGRYLVVVTSYSGRDKGEYKLSVGCTGNCNEPPCPDLTCDLYCPNGFMTDANGCPICRCKDNPDYCRTDWDCPQGFRCNPCPDPEPCDNCDPIPVDAAGSPVNGETGGAEARAECGPPTCEPIHNDFCLSDDDCPDGFRCEQVWAEPAKDCGCDDSGACECNDIAKGVCVPREQECSSDQECPAGYHCEFPFMEGAGSAEGGVNNDRTGCGQDPAAGENNSDGCIPPPGLCMPDQQRCRDNRDCPAGMVCELFDDNARTDPDTGAPECYPGQDCGSDYGVCVPGDTCNCPEYYAPVCAATPWGEQKTYDNKCFAGCDHARILHEGECEGPKPECFSDRDCPAGFRCELPVADDPSCIDENGNVRDNCNPTDCTDIDGDGQVDCFGPGVCVPVDMHCMTDSDCPPGFECQTDNTDPWSQIDWNKVDELCRQDPDMCKDLKARCDTEPDYCLKIYCELVDPAPCNQTGVCVASQHYCNSDSDCPSGQHCEAAEVGGSSEGGTDRTACVDDADCGTGRICADGGCFDCNDTEICGDGIDNDCDGEVDEDCPQPVGICVDNDKVCESDDECPEGFYCQFDGPVWGQDPDDPNGANAEICNGIDDDRDGQVDEGCINPVGRCVPSEDKQCDGDTDCPDGFFCALPQCAQSGVACNADVDCPEGQACMNGICTSGDVPPDCGPGVCTPRQDPRCIVTGCSGQVCASHEVQTDCVWRPEYDCLKYSKCTMTPDGICGWIDTQAYRKCIDDINGNDKCTNDADCGQGQYCMDGVCQAQDCACPDDYKPVCGNIVTSDGNGREETFGNLCKLRCANAELLHDGECENRKPCKTDQDCPSGFRCNTCPADPTCPECDVCGPPTCEFINGLRCNTTADCPPDTVCDASTGLCK
ncbi:MAG: hypothetical protein GXP49_12290 [Deltaproteobacteria bacterium]|nr:hypothetical protein [Deltaproteobacteria bacterium]